jgi:hypothetical protein
VPSSSPQKAPEAVVGEVVDGLLGFIGRLADSGS